MRLKLPGFTFFFKDKRVWIAAAVVGFLFMCAFYSLSNPPQQDQKRWAVAKRGSLSVDLVESGEIRAIISFDVKVPMIWGDLQIVKMVDDGTIVKAGDFVAQIDPTPMVTRLKEVYESLETAQLELKALDADQETRAFQLETDLKSSELSKELADLKKGMLKFESSLIQNQAELGYQKQMLVLDEVQTRMKNQKIIDVASRSRVLMNVQQSQEWKDRIEQRIKELTLTAPIGGMVVYTEVGGRGVPRRKIQVGDKPWPSQILASIPDPSKMETVIRVNEVDATKILVGDKVEITLDAFEKTVFHGDVTRVSKLADKKNWRAQIKDFEVGIKIKETDSSLKPGMTTQARIVLDEFPNVLYIPVGTVYEDKGKPVVFKKKNPKKPVQVELGKRNDRFVVVRQGLQTGDEISWLPSAPEFQPLGRAAEIERRAQEMAKLKANPDSSFTPAASRFSGNR
ncbi:MAG: efflux RND transporter periplasmic adaptor subunit [Candidatus Latescibacter sp.]|nr:efflux RND transporter periplasmic adaptor subunit [Candidatus Latescibacter sp.]